ncbi:MAG: glycosyltransferase [Limisphaerales bacterium]
MRIRRLILRCGLPLGDLVLLSAALRDLHFTHPGRFLTDVRTTCPDLWRHNPLVMPLRGDEGGVETVDCDEFELVNSSTVLPQHALNAFPDFLSRRLGVRFRPVLFHGDVYLSVAERRAPSRVERLVGRPLPFWLLAAGGKRDFTAKWWHTPGWQAVVEMLRGRVIFVQVGAPGDHHPRLDGVLDLRGRTTLRELILLMHHAQGVLCPVTSLMHLAAAVEPRPGRPRLRPCVVVAGGREPAHWEAYPGHRFLDNVGSLPCCADAACWKSRTLPLGDGDEHDAPAWRCEDARNAVPRCMELIRPETVVAAVESYLADGAQRCLRPDEAAAAAPWLTRPRRGRPRPRPVPEAPAEITFCVLTCGDHLRLIRRCLRSLWRHAPRAAYRLVVGANGVSTRVLSWLERMRLAGRIDRLLVSPMDVSKCPMMARMLGEVQTRYVWWLDDDSSFKMPGTLELWHIVARNSGPRTAVWGMKVLPDARIFEGPGAGWPAWVRAARWYRGRPLSRRRQGGCLPGWWFPHGGSWLARLDALRAIGWPDPRLRIMLEDVIMGEALRQQGWRMMDLGGLGGVANHEPSRGEDRWESQRLELAAELPPDF